MRVDWAEDDDFPPQASAELPVLQDGTHTACINYVAIKQESWAESSLNPHGNTVLLGLDVAGHKRVWTNVAADARAKLQALCRSARVPSPAKGEDWDEQSLKGCYVNIDTVVKVGRNGRDFVRVERFVVPPVDAPTKAPQPVAPRQTLAAKVVPNLPEDDIPF